MFYLIGVNHDAQRHPLGAALTSDQKTLELCLSNAIKRYRPALIAVEESQDSLHNDVCIPKDVASRYDIKPMLCDPTDNENEKSGLGYMSNCDILRKLRTSPSVADSIRDCLNSISSDKQKVIALAIEMRVFFPIREEFWLEKMTSYLQSDVVYVCGENHLESFSSRLHCRGVATCVICRSIGVSQEQRDLFHAAQRYPDDNPQLFNKLVRYFSS